MSLLVLNGIKKSFREHKVLKEVSLSVNPGEVYGILGPNGAGKTALLRIISGLTTADNGEVRIVDCSASMNSLHYKRSLYHSGKIVR
ncbi:ATP-binding cassette domain-containing protein [Bacillus sp. CGMCC 1.60114]|uniref:ATP-binding cassette domain-containing protein n=1 Tax=unclassified Bacillus (in: firmicutes) TaxID=185979 RepID=UPI00363E61BF